MTKPFEFDPKFPDRPLTADFAQLSEIVVQMDAEAERTQDLAPLIEPVVDPLSLLYLAEQRALRAEHLLPYPLGELERRRLVALYFDAFITGARFAQQKETHART